MRWVRKWTVCRLPHPGPLPAPAPEASVWSQSTRYCTALVPTWPNRWGAFEWSWLLLWKPYGCFYIFLLDTCPGVWKALWHMTLISPFYNLTAASVSIFWVTSCGWGPDVTWLPIHFLPSSLRAHWPWAPGSGSCLSENSWAAGCKAGRTLTFLIPHREWGCNLLLPGAHSEPLTSVWDEW